MLSLLITVLSLLPTYSFGQECKNIDHDHLIPASSNRLQGEVGSCHVFATTSLIEARHYQIQGKELDISEKDLFIKHILKDLSIYKKTLSCGENGCLSIEGGFCLNDMRLLKDEGACFEKTIPYDGNDGELISAIKKARDLVAKKNREQAVKEIETIFQRLMKQDKPYYEQEEYYTKQTAQKYYLIETNIESMSELDFKNWIVPYLQCNPLGATIKVSDQLNHAISIIGYDCKKDSYIVRDSNRERNRSMTAKEFLKTIKTLRVITDFDMRFLSAKDRAAIVDEYGLPKIETYCQEESKTIKDLRFTINHYRSREKAEVNFANEIKKEMAKIDPKENETAYVKRRDLLKMTYIRINELAQQAKEAEKKLEDIFLKTKEEIKAEGLLKIKQLLDKEKSALIKEEVKQALELIRKVKESIEPLPYRPAKSYEEIKPYMEEYLIFKKRYEKERKSYEEKMKDEAAYAQKVLSTLSQVSPLISNVPWFEARMFILYKENLEKSLKNRQETIKQELSKSS